MSIVADLVDYPLAEFLFFLSSRKMSGELTVQGTGSGVTFTLMGGTIIAAESSNQTGRLGEQLVAAGTITSEQLDQALEHLAMSAEATTIGAALVELNLLTLEEVQNALQLQCTDHLFEILKDSKRGRFEFQRAQTSLRGIDARVEMNILVFDAIRRADEWLIRRLRTDPVRLTEKAEHDLVEPLHKDDVEAMRLLRLGPVTAKILAAWMHRPYESIVDSLRRLHNHDLIVIVKSTDQTLIRRVDESIVEDASSPSHEKPIIQPFQVDMQSTKNPALAQ